MGAADQTEAYQIGDLCCSRDPSGPRLAVPHEDPLAGTESRRPSKPPNRTYASLRLVDRHRLHMKATRTTLHRQFSWNVRFLSLGFPVLDCRLILDHSDMPVGAQYSFETLTRKYVCPAKRLPARYYRTPEPGPDEYLEAPR